MGLALDQDPAGSRGVGSVQMKALELRYLWWIEAVPFGQGLRGTWCSLCCAHRVLVLGVLVAVPHMQVVVRCSLKEDKSWWVS